MLLRSLKKRVFNLYPITLLKSCFHNAWGIENRNLITIIQSKDLRLAIGIATNNNNSITSM